MNTERIIHFFQEAPEAAIFVTVSIAVLLFLGYKLFASGLIKHFKSYGK